MATVSTPKMTAGEFFDWANRPENAGRRHELVKGEPKLCPLPSEWESWRATGVVLQRYVLNHPGTSLALPGDGVLVGHDPDTVRTPHLMLFLKPIPPGEFPKRYTDGIPDLVVEVRPPSLPFPRMLQRAEAYIRGAGVPLMWLIEPDEQAVFVCRLKSSLEVFDGTDELTGNGVLPDFRCRVADLFALPGAPPATAPQP